MSEFTPVASTIGGLLIGAAAALLLVLNGRIAGISGIVGGMFGKAAGGRGWRVAFVLGLLAGGLLAQWIVREPFGAGPSGSLAWLVIAGLLVGVGTQLGSGCTSGHGVCGISRLSARSIVATSVFISVAAGTVFLTRHVLGG
jgi:uncharacterized membrane protein YedE/YeeE